MSAYISQCSLCTHEWDHTRGGDPPKARCDAFPDGIPEEIARNKVVHDKPYPGDHGIRYEYFEANSKSKAAEKDGQRDQLARRASILLKQGSDPTRLQLILILAAGELHVGALFARLNQSQPAVSHRLALLRRGGIVAPRREGKNNFYRLTNAGLALAQVVNKMENRGSLPDRIPS